MVNRLKRYFVKRWMYLLTDQELADIYTNRKLYRLIERMIDEMLKMFGDKT